MCINKPIDNAIELKGTLMHPNRTFYAGERMATHGAQQWQSRKFIAR